MVKKNGKKAMADAASMEAKLATAVAGAGKNPRKMKTVTEIQEMLSEQLDKLSRDEMNAQQANAVCNTVGKIIGSIRLQFDYCRLTGQKPRPIGFLELDTPVAADAAVAS